MEELPKKFGDRVLAGGFLGSDDFDSTADGSTPAPDPPLQIRRAPEPTPSGGAPPGFEYKGVLGEGAFGKVYRARELTSNREVAVKVVTRASERALKRFEREGQVLASLKHPGIVRVFSQGTHRGNHYLALELVEGGRTLDDAFRNAPPATRAMLVLEVAQAVAHAHAAQVVHRDLKPANVLVDLAGRPKVCDFGLASARDAERLTRTGSVMGTPQYMSPEQITGRGHGAGPTADVWALGVLLYEALTGVLPFQGQTMVQLASQITRARPEPLRDRDPSIPRAYEAVIQRAFAVDPSERYPTAAEFASALEQIGLSAWSGTGSAAAWIRARPSTGRVVAVCLGLGLLGGVIWGTSWLVASATPNDPGEALPASARQLPLEELRKLVGKEDFDAVLTETEGVDLGDMERALLRGWALRRTLGTKGETLELSRKLLATYPNDPQVALLRAQSLPPQLPPNPQIRELLELAALDQSDPYAQLALAGVIVVDEPKRARELYERATLLETTPEHRYSIQRVRGILAQDFGEHEVAIEAYREARRVRPGDTDFDALIGYSHYELGDLAAARAACERAVRAATPHLRAFDTLAQVQRKEGDFAPAIETYRAAAEHFPDDHRIYAEMGIVYLYHHEGLEGLTPQECYKRSIEAFDACLARSPPPKIEAMVRAQQDEARGLLDLSEGFGGF